MNNNSIKKEIKSAGMELEKCAIKKCSHIRDLKKKAKHMAYCQKKYKDYPLDKINEKFEKIDKCHKEGNITNEDKMEIGQCTFENCEDKMEKINELGKRLLYIKHPKGKELMEIDSLLTKTKQEKENCKKNKCGHIYPLDKLDEENKECNKLILKDKDLYKKCVDKYQIYDKNTKVNQCVKKKCGKFLKQSEKLIDRKSKLLNPMQKAGKKLTKKHRK